MDNWRDAILSCFTPKVNPLTLVEDSDRIFTEEKLVSQLKNKGFDLIEFRDAVELRFIYESNYRAGSGQKNDLIVVLGDSQGKLENLPYDMISAGKTLCFSLSDIFPNLNYPVLGQIGRQHLDTLFSARKLNQERMGENATKDFILRHVFEISPELINTDVMILRMLLRLHYRQVGLPAVLSQRLIDVLDSQEKFQDWPLSALIDDSRLFYDFLQERWPIFLDTLISGPDQIRENLNSYGLTLRGPGILPFSHEDIRVYIDNLFAERKLTPIRDKHQKLDVASWIKCGVFRKEENAALGQLSRLLEILEEQLPTEESLYTDWISFAMKMAEFEALALTQRTTFEQKRTKDLKTKAANLFLTWLETHFASLISLPSTQPVMLHHIPRRMNRYIEQTPSHRAALLVIDGLSLDQWISLKPVLENQLTDCTIRETAVFAWIPTLTSISRQAIFAGKPPLYFPHAIHTTHHEPKLWQHFWENCGFSRFEAGYKKGLGHGDPLSVLEDFDLNRIRALGLVIDTVDKIMHGMQLGNAGMHDQIKLWSQSGYLPLLVKHLLDNGFQVWLTSDHGNIECNGIGNPGEGMIAETRGERARVYQTQELRSQVELKYPEATPWDPVGLPNEFFPLLAQGTTAFTIKGKKTVTHGGASMAEVIVPLITFERTPNERKT